MKCIVILMLGVITVSSERIPVGHYESIEKDILQDENSILSGSETLDAAKKIFAKPHKQELLLPSKSVIDEYHFNSNNEISSNLPSTSKNVLAYASASSMQTLVIENDEIKNNNRSNKILDSHQDQKYFNAIESNVEVQTYEAGIGKMEVNESEEERELTEQKDIKRTPPPHEDIPSFSEWTQKQLAEAEKKRADQNETTVRFEKGRGKYRTKNYASPDCGAKIVAANPESVSSSSVLSSLKDEYMLNYCTNRIWFIVELCEAIQAKQLDLANFELFSSSPKHFSVSLSHRFPTREWSNVGKFTAEDSRDVQTFNLHPYWFGKFVKIEMHSHYGKEQFCPISWVGVYGTSEYEVLAKEDERNLVNEDDYSDSYDEEIFIGNKRHSPKNLFSSATEAVMSIVKKATAPFMKSESNETKSENCTNIVDFKNHSCFSPRYIIVCNNCTQTFYDEVFHILSCESDKLSFLLSNSFVRDTLMRSKVCIELGLDFSSVMKGAPYPKKFLRTFEQSVKYLKVMLRNSFVAALCNAMAVTENKVVINTTATSVESLRNFTEKEEDFKDNASVDLSASGSFTYIASSCDERGNECIDSSPPKSQFSAFVEKENGKSGISHSNQIQPTLTFSEEAPFFSSSVFSYTSSFASLSPSLSSFSSYSSSSSLSPPSSFFSSSTSSTSSSFIHLEPHINSPKDNKITKTFSNEYVSSTEAFAEDKIKVVPDTFLNLIAEEKNETQKDVESGESRNSHEINQDSTTLESIISDLNAMEKVVNAPSNSFTSTNLPAESIFLRLANRIKNLEINMSLSSTYLEELSRRYKMQLELLSKSLNGTMQKVEEYAKAEEEKERRREKEMLLIRMQIANLSRDVSAFAMERNSWRPDATSVSQHVLLITAESLLIWIIFTYWKKSDDGLDATPNSTKKLGKKIKRRISLEGVKGHEVANKKKKRRPSEEALDIALSRTYKNLHLKVEKKKKRRKKDSKCSLNGYQPVPKRRAAEMEDFEKSYRRSENEENFDCVVSVPEACSTRNGQRNSCLTKDGVSESNKTFSTTGAKSSFRGAGKAVEGLAPPAFMKTALAVRNIRMRERESSENVKPCFEALKTTVHKDRKSSNSIKKYMKKFF